MPMAGGFEYVQEGNRNAFLVRNAGEPSVTTSAYGKSVPVTYGSSSKRPVATNAGNLASASSKAANTVTYNATTLR